uniref:C2H2-type domain-containing protein n=1 Tax=Tetraodon nigroviridis TaxID=99883 RepID=H3C464_TETNG
SVAFSQGMDSMAGAQSELCFSFSSDKIKVDWRRINAVNIDLLVRQVDIDALQEHIRDVTYCSLETVRCTWCLTPVDPTLVKLFRLAQLSLEWLHHCQEKLISSLRGMEDKVKSSDTKCKKLQAKSKGQEQKMKKMVSELKARRNIIQKQQSMFAKYMSSSVQCQHCDKKYMNGFFLQEHMLRRHPSQCQNYDQEQNQRLQQEKLQLVTEKGKLQQGILEVREEAVNLQQENLTLKSKNSKLKAERKV